MAYTDLCRKRLKLISIELLSDCNTLLYASGESTTNFPTSFLGDLLFSEFQDNETYYEYLVRNNLWKDSVLKLKGIGPRAFSFLEEVCVKHSKGFTMESILEEFSDASRISSEKSGFIDDEHSSEDKPQRKKDEQKKMDINRFLFTSDSGNCSPPERANFRSISASNIHSELLDKALAAIPDKKEDHLEKFFSFIAERARRMPRNSQNELCTEVLKLVDRLDAQ